MNKESEESILLGDIRSLKESAQIGKRTIGFESKFAEDFDLVCDCLLKSMCEKDELSQKYALLEASAA